MSTADVASHLVSLCKAGNFAEAGDTYWADDVVSVEPMGDTPTLTGKAAVHGKGEWWSNAHDIHGVEVFGPYVNGDQFTVRFVMDVTVRETGARHTMDEVALYTLRDGKIAEERFFYGG